MLNPTKYLTAIFLFAIFLFIACKKNKPTSVSGTVVDATTSTGIANATVYLQQTENNCFSCQPGTIATYTADANGNFNFNIDGQKGHRYSVVASATNYFNNFGTGGSSIDEHTANTITVSLNPVAWLKLHIKNTTPFDTQDRISLEYYEFYGASIDTSIIIKKYGNANNQIYYWVTKNNIEQTLSINPYCIAFDTTLYNINY